LRIHHKDAEDAKGGYFFICRHRCDLCAFSESSGETIKILKIQLVDVIGLEGDMGFFRQQQEKMAMKYLIWQHQRMNIPIPPISQLQQQAVKIVNDAHKIAKERGKNVLGIMKELAEDIKKDKMQ